MGLTPRQVIYLDNAFGGKNQLKTNTVLEMRDHEIEFWTVCNENCGIISKKL